MLGGSSGLNMMLFARPSPGDIDDWSEVLGLQGWTWADLLPYFKRSEMLESRKPESSVRNPGEYPSKDDSHGKQGPIHISTPSWYFPFEDDLLRALDEVSGFERPVDPYNGSRIGFWRSLFSINRTALPTRSYAANAYLAPVLGQRPNLKILTNATATKIILEEAQRQPESVLSARGVEFLYDGERHTVHTRREVILSAGSIQSPQLLELSGIGDAAILDKAGVPCRVANPNVGSNLQDHTLTGVTYELADGIQSLDSIVHNTSLQAEHFQLYAQSGSGAFSGCVNLGGFVPFSFQASESEVKEVVATIVPDGQGAHRRDSTQNQAFQEVQRRIIANRFQSSGSPDLMVFGAPTCFNFVAGGPDQSKAMSGLPGVQNACYTLTVSNAYPLSRGSVHIQTNNPLDPPVIDLGYLSHPADVDILSAAVSFADRVFRSPVLKDQVTRRVAPPPEINLEDREEVRKSTRDRLITYHHALGTCALGQVVDERLRVKGVGGLRIVDASVLPMQTSAAPLATVYAVAEKAADIIKEDFGLKV